MGVEGRKRSNRIKMSIKSKDRRSKEERKD